MNLFVNLSYESSSLANCFSRIINFINLFMNLLLMDLVLLSTFHIEIDSANSVLLLALHTNKYINSVLDLKTYINFLF